MKILYAMLILFLPFVGQGQVITTICGNGTATHTGDGGQAITATITTAGAGIFDKFDNFYFSEGSGNRIRKIDPFGIITTIVGTGVIGFSGDGGPATAAALRDPKYSGMDTAGNLYITDIGNLRVRKVNMSTGIITTIAGTGITGFSGDGGPATAAALGAPVSVVVDSFGDIYIGDQTYNIIRKIDAAGIITTIAGTPGVSSYSGDGGPATAAELISLEGMILDKHGNIYIINGDKVRKIDIGTGIISTYAGDGNTSYAGDGGAAVAASFNSPFALAFNAYNELYLADTKNNRIRKIDTFGIVNTVVGNGIEGFSGDGGSAITSELNWPEGVAFDQCGNLYIVDLLNYRIRKITYPPILTTPSITLSAAPAAFVGTAVTITATVANAGSSYLIHWLNHGLEFTTTTVPSVTYIKTNNTDTITARVVSTAAYGCYDSTTSAAQIVLIGEGVSSVYNVSYSVYPNPVSHVIYVDGVLHASAYRLLSMVGAVLQQGRLQQGSNSIPVQSLPPGMYMLEVTGSDGGRGISKIIKQ